MCLYSGYAIAIPTAVLPAWWCSNPTRFFGMKAAGSGAVQGLDFVGAHQLDKASARQIPVDMIGRLIHDGDLRKLQQAIAPTKPVAPSVQRRPAAKRSMRRQ